MSNKFKLTLQIALSYIVGAQFGFLLGLLPDSPITVLWPPSGVALASVLLWGRIALPGVFLGALITNLLLLLETPTWAAFGAGVTVSVASTVAALVAGGLLKRFAPSAPIWGSAADMLIGSMAMGLACTIAAVFGVGSLYASGQLPDEAVRATLGMWWLGDFCGMLIFTPMAFAIARRFKGTFWRRIRPEVVASPTIFNCIVSMVALAIFLFIWILEGARISQTLEREASIAANSLTQTLNRAGRDLKSVSSLMSASEHVTEKEFQKFTAALFEKTITNTVTHGVGWAPRVTNPKAWEMKMLSSGHPLARLFERDESGQKASVTKRGEYFPLQFIHSKDSVSQGAVGFDLGSERMRRKTLERARDTGQMSMAVPVTLSQSEAGKQLAMQICLPIYRRYTTLDTVADRRANHTGVACGVYLIGVFFSKALINTVADIDIHLFDDSLPSGPQWYYTKYSPSRGKIDEVRPAPTLTDLTAGFSGATSIDFAGRKWLLISTPGTNYIGEHRTWTPWWALTLLLALGIVISSIMIERILAQKRIDTERLKTETALHDARAANESKSYFMAAASHDIKQPLYALSILTDTLLMTNPPENTIPIVKSLSKSIKEMSQHFDTLMDVGRFQDGSFEVIPSSVSLSDLARRIDMEIAPLCSEKGLDWNIDVDDVLVHTDAELLLRLIRNLLINAVGYTSDGEVSFSAKTQGKSVYCKVCDTGKGLSQDQQELVFREIQVRDSEIHNSGHGLGLSIVNKVSQALDLGLQVVSSKDKGTVFTFRLRMST